MSTHDLERRAEDEVERRFWAKVEKTPTCWLWQASTNPRGYGRFTVRGRTVYPHRWIYERTVRPIPDGWVIDHLCRVHNCVNPDHLEAVTQSTNAARGLLGFDFAGLCRAGLHDVSTRPNLYVRPTGERDCRACMSETQRKRRKASA